MAMHCVLSALARRSCQSQQAASCTHLTRCFSAASAAQQHNGALEPYDVVVFGGGMVGVVFAALLGCNPLTRDLRVAVVDRQKLSGQQKELGAPPELRVSTITPASAAILQRIGAWRHLDPPISAAFSSMQVWDAAGQAYIRYEAADVEAEHIGHVVENSRIVAAAVAQLRAVAETRPAVGRGVHGGVHLLTPAALKELHFPSAVDPREGASLAQLSFEGGSSISARLVVGADGANSRVRSAAGLRTVGWSYEQRGVVATVETGTPNHTAWQRFLPNGPLALLPARSGYSNIVWSTSPDQARQLERMSSAEFAIAVNSALGSSESAPTAPLTAAIQGWLPGAAPAAPFQSPPPVGGFAGGPPRSFPLQLKHSGRYVRKRVALVGDAAHAVHPLAGQGVNLGLADAAALADALAAAVQGGVDLGDDTFLADEYEAPRQRANVAMAAALDGLGRIFKPQSGPVAALRSAGLDLLNASGSAKQQIMRYAMGWV